MSDFLDPNSYAARLAKLHQRLGRCLTTRRNAEIEDHPGRLSLNGGARVARSRMWLLISVIHAFAACVYGLQADEVAPF
jgi:hypothetical protein